jgi:hypothetical protein
MLFVRLITIALAALAVLAPTAGAAKQTTKKGMWGPVTVNGKSAFPIYKELGVGIWQTTMRWYDVAPSRPVLATDPRDPTYRWPSSLDYAVRQAKRNKIKILVAVSGSPAWANGGKDPRWAPKRVADFANFMKAASKRYPSVRYWMIWGEPMRQDNFMPIRHERRGHKLNKKQRRGPQRYAQLLNAAYGALKSVNRKDKIVGGNTFTTGDISPKNWIHYMRLPSGRRARLDLWGHNPFGSRKPDLRDRALGHGFADFGTLDTLARWLNRWQGRKRLFLSEYTLPTDHANHEFNFWAPRKVQASFAGAALRITRRWKRIHTLGWHELLDEAPRNTNGAKHGDETHRGLMTYTGKRKRAYRAFKRG